MALATLKPDSPSKNVPVIPEAQEETFKGIVADNRKEPLIQLLPYIDGISWTLHAWYGQLLGEHNELRELDTGDTGAYQQYQRTSKLEVRVTAGLSSSYSSETGMTTVTGSANLHTLAPNVHDYFLADAGSRRMGLFRVTNVERKTFNRDSVYSIDYALVGYAENSPMVQKLESKVVRRYRFVKDRLVEGLAPLLREEQYEITRDLHDAIEKLEKYYFQTFVNHKYGTFVIPGQSVSIYDAWLVEFVMQIANVSDIRGITSFRRVSMDRDRYLQQRQLWSMLLSRDIDQHPYIHAKVGLVSRMSFNRSSWIKSAAYWNILQFVYPIIEDDPVIIEGNVKPTTVTGMMFMETSPFPRRTAIFRDETNPSFDEELQLIKPVLVDDYYVLSAAFYSGEGEMSALEVLVKDYLKMNTLDLSVLQALNREYLSWPVLEQFYYGPLLMLLMKEAIKGFYEDVR